MPRKLKEIDVEELSLVDDTATRKKFYILKRRKIMDELIEMLKNSLGEEAVTAEVIAKAKELPDEKVEEIKKAVKSIEEYRDVFPAAFGDAVNVLIKNSSYDYPEREGEVELDVEKAGAALSKATVEQLRKIADIVKKLIGEKTEKLAKDKDGNELPAEVQAKLEELDEYKRAEKEQIEKERKEKEKADKEEKEKLLERIEALEKGRGVKKSISGQETETDADDDDEEEDKYPSMVLPTK